MSSHSERIIAYRGRSGIGRTEGTNTGGTDRSYTQIACLHLVMVCIAKGSPSAMQTSTEFANWALCQLLHVYSLTGNSSWAPKLFMCAILSRCCVKDKGLGKNEG